MLLDLYGGALWSAAMPCVLLIGLSLIFNATLDSKSNLHRTILFAISGLLTCRYLYWRATTTLAALAANWDCFFSWTFFTLEAAAGLSSLSAFLILSRTKSRSDEVDVHSGWWGTPAPKVALLIATYNEDRDILERSIIGAKASEYGNCQVYVLDDGKRDWLRDFCRSQGVHYVRRSDNRGSKAGNINHALDLLGKEPEPPQFVAVLDADFVPHRNFIPRAMALFHDPHVGLVQTPQHFFNPDPIQHNLGLSRTYPDEQRFFFDHLQPSRDAWGIAFCCGTSSLIRWDALQRIGGFPTDSITEDFLLTLVLKDAGFTTAYLNEALTEGLAPEGLKEYVTQRARWCLGLMQIARSRFGPFGRSRLKLADRWSVLDSTFYWLTSFSFRLAAVTFPLLYWYFNVTVVNASVPDIIFFFTPYFYWVLFSLNFVSRGSSFRSSTMSANFLGLSRSHALPLLGSSSQKAIRSVLQPRVGTARKWSFSGA